MSKIFTFVTLKKLLECLIIEEEITSDNLLLKYDDEPPEEAIENENIEDDARSDEWNEIGKDLKPLNLSDIRATENVKKI